MRASWEALHAGLDRSVRTLQAVWIDANNMVRINASARTISFITNGNVVTSGNLTWDTNDLITVTVKHNDAGNARLAVAGASSGNGTWTGTAGSWPSSTIYWGGDSGTAQAGVRFGRYVQVAA